MNQKMASEALEQSYESVSTTLIEDTHKVEQASENGTKRGSTATESKSGCDQSCSSDIKELEIAQANSLTTEFQHHAVEAGEPQAGSAFHVVKHTDGCKDTLVTDHLANESERSNKREINSVRIESKELSDSHGDEIAGKVAKHFAAHIVEQHKLASDDSHKETVATSWRKQPVLDEAADENELLASTSTEATGTEVGVNLEEIDEAVEKALLAGDDDDDNSCSKETESHMNEEVDAAEALNSKNVADFKFLKPTKLEGNAKDSSLINGGMENDVESELQKHHTTPVHKPERVYDIDEETRMGLDQTPIDSSLCEASFIYPSLPPKKLFHIDDKDSEPSDSETKLSAMTDTEDIRLRNTISIDDATKDSGASDSNMETPTPSKKHRRASRDGLGISVLEGLEAGERLYTAENLFEYQWPQDGGEWHLLQEQVSEFLKVKSFKRKYPDLYRRTCDKEEKDFLREKGVVTETQSDLGLTALRSEEVYDLMMKDYNDRYKEYISHLQEKQKKVIHEKHKEYSAQAKLDKTKIDSYSKKAARSAAEFNASLMRDKKDERRAYFDLQTYTIHFPQNRYRTLPPHLTKVGPYPVALINGQYQENYRKFTPEELRYYPIMTSLKDPPKPVKYIRPPPPGVKLPSTEKQSKTVVDSDEEDSDLNSDDDNLLEEDKNDMVENEDKENKESQMEEIEIQTPVKVERERKFKSIIKRKTPKTSSPDRLKKGKKNKEGEEKNDDKSSQDGDDKLTSPECKKMPGKIHGLEKCRICKQRSTKEERKNDMLVKCAECGKIGHMGCLDLTEELVAVIKTYPWQCMECKTCVECLDPYDEDKMMFCDRCDRGYHTFCIGLSALPTGHWECKSCEGCPKILPKSKLKKPSLPLEAASEVSNSEIKNEIDIKHEDEMKEGELSWSTESQNEGHMQSIVVSNVSGDRGVVDKEAAHLEKGGTTAASTVNSILGIPIKIERRGRKRKNPDIAPKPKPLRQDRIQGARQSKRLKLKGEEEEERRKKSEEKKLRKKKRKKMEEEDLKNAMAGRESGVFIVNYGETVQDEFREIVSEGVDDSIVNMFDKIDDEIKDLEAAGKFDVTSMTEMGALDASVTSGLGLFGIMGTSVQKADELVSGHHVSPAFVANENLTVYDQNDLCQAEAMAASSITVTLGNDIMSTVQADQHWEAISSHDIPWQQNIQTSQISLAQSSHNIHHPFAPLTPSIPQEGGQQMFIVPPGPLHHQMTEPPQPDLLAHSVTLPSLSSVPTPVEANITASLPQTSLAQVQPEHLTAQPSLPHSADLKLKMGRDTSDIIQSSGLINSTIAQTGTIFESIDSSQPHRIHVMLTGEEISDTQGVQSSQGSFEMHSKQAELFVQEASTFQEMPMSTGQLRLTAEEEHAAHIPMVQGMTSEQHETRIMSQTEEMNASLPVVQVEADGYGILEGLSVPHDHCVSVAQEPPSDQELQIIQEKHIAADECPSEVTGQKE